MAGGVFNVRTQSHRLHRFPCELWIQAFFIIRVIKTEICLLLAVLRVTLSSTDSKTCVDQSRAPVVKDSNHTKDGGSLRQRTAESPKGNCNMWTIAWWACYGWINVIPLQQLTVSANSKIRPPWYMNRGDGQSAMVDDTGKTYTGRFYDSVVAGWLRLC